MITELTVTEPAATTRLPTADTTVVAFDFAFDQVPELAAGSVVVRLRNNGRQLHELNLAELPEGTTIDNVAAWYRQPTGPPPMRSLSGVAVRPGGQASATFRLAAGSNYAFLCAIPDTRGDFTPHVTKSMFTCAFTAIRR